MFQFHPDGLLFTKIRSNPKALLDLAFHDNFGRFHDRKETPKTMKQFNCLFPEKVPIQIPQDETGLLDWKQQLDRDLETRKLEANICSIRSGNKLTKIRFYLKRNHDQIGSTKPCIYLFKLWRP